MASQALSAEAFKKAHSSTLARWRLLTDAHNGHCRPRGQRRRHFAEPTARATGRSRASRPACPHAGHRLCDGSPGGPGGHRGLVAELASSRRARRTVAVYDTSRARAWRPSAPAQAASSCEMYADRRRPCARIGRAIVRRHNRGIAEGAAAIGRHARVELALDRAAHTAGGRPAAALLSAAFRPA